MTVLEISARAHATATGPAPVNAVGDNSSGTTTLLDAVLELIDRPLHPVPVPYRQKKPELPGWQRLRIDKTNAEQYFDGRPGNVGVLLGDEYGSADLDCDCLEAVAAAQEFAPETGMIYGRASRPRSHYFYYSDPPFSSRKYVDPSDRETIVELRCQKKDGTAGFQSIVPPSTHKETGEQIRYEAGCHGRPANVEAVVLQGAVIRIAAAALLAKHWPAVGHGRHDCELALSGCLARAAWPRDDAEQFVLATYRAVPDHDRSALERVRTAVHDSFDKHGRGDEITGFTTLAQSVGDTVAKCAMTWLGVTADRGQTTPPRTAAPAATPKSNDKATAAQLQAVDGLALFRAQYAEPVPVVDGLLYQGVTVFAGRPKIGKSWFALDLARAVALGSKFLGRMGVRRAGRVVYLALEEPQARTSNRLRKLVGSPEPGLSNLHFIYRVKPLLNGGAAEVDAYLTAHPAELVVIDTLLAIVRAGNSRDVLRTDYNEVNVLRQLAEKHQTAIVVVHHLRKASAENGLDAVAGTTGLTAACDAIWTLKRMPGGDFLLEATGREMEDKSYGLRFGPDEPFGWRIIGEGPEVGLSEERQEILELLKDEAPLKPAKMAAMLRKNAVTVRRLLQKLYADGHVQKNRDGSYLLSSHIPMNSVNE